MGWRTRRTSTTRASRRGRAAGTAARQGASVTYNDPHIPTLPRMRRHPDLRMASRDLTPEYVRAQDCILVVTDHSAYDWSWIVANAPLVVDTRNATKQVAANRDRIVRA
ncbi:MAG: UDP binding domain-containing protein [Singulisphaera sp.]